MSEDSLLNISISLFIVLNAAGQIPLFITALKPYDHSKQKKIIIRELLFVLAILILFAFFGDNILKILGITGSIIGMAGGILLFLIALTMIFPKEDLKEGLAPHHEPIFVPLAIPALAGPGSITAVMVYSTVTDNAYFVSLAIFIAWSVSLVILLASSYIQKFLGDKGLAALQRLGGMIVCLIGIQMFSKGVVDLVKENFFPLKVEEVSTDRAQNAPKEIVVVPPQQ